MELFQVKIKVKDTEKHFEFGLNFNKNTPEHALILTIRSIVKAEERDTILLQDMSIADGNIYTPISAHCINPEKEYRLIVDRQANRTTNRMQEEEQAQIRKRKSADGHQSGTKRKTKKRAKDSRPTTMEESKLASNNNSSKYFWKLQKRIKMRNYYSSDSLEELFKLSTFPKFPTNVAFDSESSADGYAVFDCETGYNDLEFVSSVLINSNHSFDNSSKTENGNQRLLDDLIVKPINWYSKKVDFEDGFRLEVARNSSKPPYACTRSQVSLSSTTATTTTDKGNEHRLDASLWCSNICFMKCEEKADESDFDKCKSQLESNMGILSSKFYGAVPYIFCIAIANYKVTIYRCDRLSNDKQLHVLRTLDLRETGQRLALIACSLLIARLVHTFYSEKLFNRECPMPLNALNSRPNHIKVGIIIEGTIAKSEYFYKEMLVTENPTFHSVDHILQVYAYLQTGQIPYTTRVLDYRINHKNNKLEIKTSPVCLESMPFIVVKGAVCVKSLRQALVAVIKALRAMHKLGVVHRDVRWPNVMFDPEAKDFVLIDFEHSGPNNQLVISAVRKYPADIAAKKKPYTFATDMFMVGKLLEDLKHMNGFSQEMRTLMNDLLVDDEEARPIPLNVIRYLNHMKI